MGSGDGDLLAAINAAAGNRLSSKVMHEVLPRLIAAGLVDREEVEGGMAARDSLLADTAWA